jgi:LPS sulfotransferase NodH
LFLAKRGCVSSLPSSFCCCAAAAAADGVTKYWLLADARSGTTLLDRLLNAHPNVAHVHQQIHKIIRTNEKQGNTFDANALADTMDSLLDRTVAYDNVFVPSEGRKEVKAVGLKMAPTPFYIGKTLGHRFDDPLDSATNLYSELVHAHAGFASVRFIHLVRRDEIARLLSFIEARNTTTYVSLCSRKSIVTLYLTNKT